MTQAELEAYLLEKERLLGLEPRESIGLWGQESSYSTDPSLKGQYLPKHNDYARGPFQVVPKFHPTFPVDGTLKEQADAALQIYASGGETPEQRQRRYYGTGTPPKGHPSTEKYAMLSNEKRGKTFSDQSQQQPMQEQAMDQYQIEDPDERLSRVRGAYTPQYMERAQYRDPYAEVNYQPRERGFLENWLSNPLTQGGIAMLMANSGDPTANIGYGLQVAGHAYGQRAQADNELYELQAKRAEARQKARRETVLENREVDKYNAGIYKEQKLLDYADSIEKDDPKTASLIRAGITTGVAAPTSFAPQIYKRGDQYVEVVFDNKGQRVERPVPAGAVPFNAEVKTPQYQGAVAEAKSGSAKIGEYNAMNQINQPKEVAKANAAVELLNELLMHEGLPNAVGFSSKVPTMPGSKAADYETKFKQLGGQNFLQAFESLKGGGAITEIEGQKATEAIAALSLAQSEAAHKRELMRLIEIARAASERAARGEKVQNPYTGTFIPATPVQANTPKSVAPTGVPATPTQGGSKVRRKWNREKGAFE